MRLRSTSVLAAVLSVAALTPPSVAKDANQGLLFENATGATVRIEAAPLINGKVAQVVIAPRSQQFLVLSQGAHKLDIIAFRARPQRVHHIGVEVSSGAVSSYRFTPAATGLYLLVDAPKGLPEEVGQGRPNQPDGDRDEPTPADADLIAQPCERAAGSKERAVLWFGADQAQRYAKLGDLLCGVDGADYFQGAGVYRHHVCDSGWKRCVRHAGGDIRVLPAIHTSEPPDSGSILARRCDPGAAVLQTQRVVAPFDPSLKAWITFYLQPGAAREARECAPGFRLHYQGFCINMEDELSDDPQGVVRVHPPEGAAGANGADAGLVGCANAGGSPPY